MSVVFLASVNDVYEKLDTCMLHTCVLQCFYDLMSVLQCVNWCLSSGNDCLDSYLHIYVHV